jgi:hypothetical protein
MQRPFQKKNTLSKILREGGREGERERERQRERDVGVLTVRAVCRKCATD